MKQLALNLILILFCAITNAQSVAINNTGAVAANSALLDISSNTKGVLVPRMSKAQKNSIATPAIGLLIFQNAPDSTGFYYYNGTVWLWLATASNATDWSTVGNAGTDTAINFIGTTDNMPLRFKQSNQWIGQFNANNGNFFIGTNSGINTTTSTNTAYGASSLVANTTGIGNLAVGSAAMQASTTASRNTAVGDSSLYNQSFNGGSNYFTDNTAIGSKALFYNQPTNTINGYKNTAIGSEALYLNTTGYENTAVGTGAMHDNITGRENTAVGRSAHRLSKSGIRNTYIGFEAGYNDSVNNNSVGIGYRALRSSSSSQNTAIGALAMNNHKTGGGNVALGYQAISNDTTGNDNTAIGYLAMSAGGELLYNTAVGSRSLQHTGENSTNTLEGNYNTALGVYSGIEIRRGFHNVAIGYYALRSDTSGKYNTAIGSNAAGNLQGGEHNVAIGYFAMNRVKGSNKVGIGYVALSNDTSATGNIAVGSTAMQFNYRGVNNIAIGVSAMRSNISGSRNIAIGDSTLMLQNFSVGNAIDHSTNNTAIGYKALFTNQPTSTSNGINNTAVGYLSGLNITTGTGNTFLGASSNAASGDLINTSAIGFQSLAAQSNSLVLGSVSGINGATSSVNVGMGTHIPLARLHVVNDSSIVPVAVVHTSATALFENDGTNYIQLLTPNINQSGIIAGNEETGIRSAIMFNADSSMNIRSGGNVTRMTIDNSGFVGVRTTAPLSYLDVPGSTANAISTSTVSTTLDQFDHTHIILPTASAVVITLPTANTCARREYIIVNQDNSVHVITSYLDFTGAASMTLPTNTSITIQSNGTNWYRIR